MKYRVKILHQLGQTLSNFEKRIEDEINSIENNYTPVFGLPFGTPGNTGVMIQWGEEDREDTKFNIKNETQS